MHHYKCKALHRAISLQRDQFWAASLVSRSFRPINVLQCWSPRWSSPVLQTKGSKMIWLVNNNITGNRQHPKSSVKQSSKQQCHHRRQRPVIYLLAEVMASTNCRRDNVPLPLRSCWRNKSAARRRFALNQSAQHLRHSLKSKLLHTFFYNAHTTTAESLNSYNTSITPYETTKTKDM